MAFRSLLLCLFWKSIKMGWLCCIFVYLYLLSLAHWGGDLQCYQWYVFRNWIRPQILTSIYLPSGVRAFMAHVLKLCSTKRRDRHLTLFNESWGFSHNPNTPATGAFRKMPYCEILHEIMWAGNTKLLCHFFTKTKLGFLVLLIWHRWWGAKRLIFGLDDIQIPDSTHQPTICCPQPVSGTSSLTRCVHMCAGLLILYLSLMEWPLYSSPYLGHGNEPLCPDPKSIESSHMSGMVVTPSHKFETWWGQGRLLLLPLLEGP